MRKSNREYNRTDSKRTPHAKQRDIGRRQARQAKHTIQGRGR
jgi:hypothetical protein